jgi:DNA-binding transcriptional LysR family regulator
VEFDLDLNDRQVDLLAEGFDLAVRIAELRDSTLIARRLAPVRHVVCASPAYLARNGTPSRAAELADHACLVYANAPSPGVWEYQDLPAARAGAGAGAHPGQQRRLPAPGGGGWSRHRAGAELHPPPGDRRGSTGPHPHGSPWLTLHAYAVYPRTRHLSQRVRAFVDFLAERFAGVPYWDRCLEAGDGSPS